MGLKRAFRSKHSGRRRRNVRHLEPRRFLLEPLESRLLLSASTSIVPPPMLDHQAILTAPLPVMDSAPAESSVQAADSTINSSANTSVSAASATITWINP